MPRHSSRPGNPHAKVPLSSLRTIINLLSTPAEFREPLNLFRIGRLPPAERYLTEPLIPRANESQRELNLTYSPYIRYNQLAKK